MMGPPVPGLGTLLVQDCWVKLESTRYPLRRYLTIWDAAAPLAMFWAAAWLGLTPAPEPFTHRLMPDAASACGATAVLSTKAAKVAIIAGILILSIHSLRCLIGFRIKIGICDPRRMTHMRYETGVTGWCGNYSWGCNIEPGGL